MKQTVLLGITGGIAAVKIPSLLDQLMPHVSVETIMTLSAVKIVPAREIEGRTGKPVYTELFPYAFRAQDILTSRKVEHIALADRLDLIVVVPATANIIAKLASGLADDYLTTTVLAATCPVIVCPSMNVHMWHHPATQKNIATLRRFGYRIAGPDSGMLACGYEGTGRLIDIPKLSRMILSQTALTKPLSGKRILVTAGATIEPIDDVRFITNKSSGKMGVAIAEAAKAAGAHVLLLRSETAVAPRMSIDEQTFDTADALQLLVKNNCKNFDICIHTAAVSDFQVKNKKSGKTSSRKPLALELEPRRKILQAIKQYNPDIFLVAFKAEFNVSDQELITLARERLAGSNADLIVANDVGRTSGGFGSDENEVTIIPKTGTPVHVPIASKAEIAQRIIRFL